MLLLRCFVGTFLFLQSFITSYAEEIRSYNAVEYRRFSNFQDVLKEYFDAKYLSNYNLLLGPRIVQRFTSGLITLSNIGVASEACANKLDNRVLKGAQRSINFDHQIQLFYYS
jgi:hypothetical protein